MAVDNPNAWNGAKRYGRDIATMMRRVNALEDISCYVTGDAAGVGAVLPNGSGDGFLVSITDTDSEYVMAEVDLDGNHTGDRWLRSESDATASILVRGASFVSGIVLSAKPTGDTLWVGLGGRTYRLYSMATGINIGQYTVPIPAPNFTHIGSFPIDDDVTRHYFHNLGTTIMEEWSLDGLVSSVNLPLPYATKEFRVIAYPDPTYHLVLGSTFARLQSETGALLATYALTVDMYNSGAYSGFWVDDTYYISIPVDGGGSFRIAASPASSNQISTPSGGNIVASSVLSGGVVSGPHFSDKFYTVGISDWIAEIGDLHQIAATTENDFGQTEFLKYPTFNTSATLGTPDGGATIPALDGLDNLGAARGNYTDLRTAIEALAPTRINALTGNPFNWTDADADNLYFNAVDRTIYGEVTATGYDWRRDDLANVGAYDIDIGEIDDCLTLLEASSLTPNLACV